MNTLHLPSASLGLVFAVLAPGLCFGQAQLEERVIHSFSGGSDGQEPYAGLLQGTDGALYGTTFEGGTNKAGLVFKVNPDGSSNAPIWNFEGNSIDPGGLSNPSGLIQGADGALYGTEGFGGTNSVGSVFKVNMDGTRFTVLHSFSQLAGGPYEPTAAVIQGDDGMLYGTTQFGGPAGIGAVFKISTNGTGYETLHTFGSIPNDGNQPQAPLIQGLDGALYGTTSLGGVSAVGGASGFGTVFKLNRDGSGFTIIHNFLPKGGDGQLPFTAWLAQGNDGVIYGTTQQGGSTSSGGSTGSGTVFKLNPDGNGFAILHSFGVNPNEGKFPDAAMVMGADGALYGVTEQGGLYNYGVVFTLQTNGKGYVELYHFGANSTDARYPGSPLIQAADSVFFSTTKFGGKDNLGTVFRIAPAPPVISDLKPLPDKSMRLSIRAASNFVFRVEASSDHKTWTAITNVLNSTGTFQVIDHGAMSASQRYYRAAWVP